MLTRLAQCYTTCDWANPAKSTDFGCDGFTASLTDYHELLQLTAPDKDCGIVFVRGNFPNTPDAILARAQVRDDTGSKGTFDIHFRHDPEDKTSGYELGVRRAQGLANFRWPYTQYELKRKGVDEAAKGSYEGISFIKDGTMFQILRLTSGRLPRNIADTDTRSIQFQIGGKVQFGCPCSNGVEQSSTKEFEFTAIDDGCRLVYKSKHYTHRLDIQVFVNNQPAKITENRTTSSGTVEIELSKHEPIVIISTYTLRDISKETNPPMISDLSSMRIEDYLGISNTSLEMTDKL